jgi:hypothetical protein
VRLGRITRAEWLTVAAILGVLIALPAPVVGPRPRPWTRVPIPPLHLEAAPLESVLRRFDLEMRRQGRLGLRDIEWQSDEWKSRPVTRTTREALPLRDVLARLEGAADVRFEMTPTCGTCGGPEGPPMLRVFSQDHRSVPVPVRLP